MRDWEGLQSDNSLHSRGQTAKSMKIQQSHVYTRLHTHTHIHTHTLTHTQIDMQASFIYFTYISSTNTNVVNEKQTSYFITGNSRVISTLLTVTLVQAWNAIYLPLLSYQCF